MVREVILNKLKLTFFFIRVHGLVHIHWSSHEIMETLCTVIEWYFRVGHIFIGYSRLRTINLLTVSLAPKLDCKLQVSIYLHQK